MAILIKTGPLKPGTSVGTILRLKEKAYGNPVFGARERAFIWVDGDGAKGQNSNLLAEGMILEEPMFDDPSKSGTLTSVKLVLTRIGPEKSLNYSVDLRPHIDDPTDSLMHSLAEIICKEVHRKITSLTPAQEAFLLSRFES